MNGRGFGARRKKAFLENKNNDDANGNRDVGYVEYRPNEPILSADQGPVFGQMSVPDIDVKHIDDASKKQAAVVVVDGIKPNAVKNAVDDVAGGAAQNDRHPQGQSRFMVCDARQIEQDAGNGQNGEYRQNKFANVFVYAAHEPGNGHAEGRARIFDKMQLEHVPDNFYGLVGMHGQLYRDFGRLVDGQYCAGNQQIFM